MSDDELEALARASVDAMEAKVEGDFHRATHAPKFMFPWCPGDHVEIVDDFNGRSFTACRGRVVCKGVVERLTKAQIIVRNEHGNEARFWLKNNRCVGYCFPHLTHMVRKAD